MKDKSTKEFTEWNKQKIEINRKETFDKEGVPIKQASPGEIWWCGLGKNVGYEQDGKNENFSRPILILRKIDKNLLLVAPTSTKPKKGYWYIEITTVNNLSETVLLNQVKTLSVNRLDNRIDKVKFKTLKRVIAEFCKKIAPPK